jgi:hypothetical protein
MTDMSIFNQPATQSSFGGAPTPPGVPSTPSPPSFGTSLINKASAPQSYGFAQSILTSAQGDLKPLSTAKKSLLGQ